MLPITLTRFKVGYFVCVFDLLNYQKKQWECYYNFNATIAIVLVISQKRQQMITKLVGVIFERAMSDIFVRKGHIKVTLASSFNQSNA